jgi:hypothetical protein
VPRAGASQRRRAARHSRARPPAAADATLAVINEEFALCPLWALCVFDAGLPEPILASVSDTHPQLVTAAGRTANADFVDPATYLRALPVPAEPLEDTVPALADDEIGDYIGLRHAVCDLLETVDGAADVLGDFLMAVDEMTSNAVRHGTPPAGLRLWTAPGRLMATIRDSGSGLGDPSAGYGPAHREDLSHGARRGLAGPAQHRGAHPPAGRPARTPRPHRGPRPRRLTQLQKNWRTGSARPALTRACSSPIHGSVWLLILVSLQ